MVLLFIFCYGYFINDKNFSNSQHLQITNDTEFRIWESCLLSCNTLWEKEKILFAIIFSFSTQFLAHLSTECSVSYGDHSLSVVVRPSIHNFLVNTLASTNINHSAPNLVRMYITIRSRMSSIMEIIEPELFELSALEYENLPYLTLLTH